MTDAERDFIIHSPYTEADFRRVLQTLGTPTPQAQRELIRLGCEGYPIDQALKKVRAQRD